MQIFLHLSCKNRVEKSRNKKKSELSHRLRGAIEGVHGDWFEGPQCKEVG